MYKHFPTPASVVKGQKKCKCYMQFLLIQSGLNVCLRYGGRKREVFSVPIVEAC